MEFLNSLLKKHFWDWLHGALPYYVLFSIHRAMEGLVFYAKNFAPKTKKSHLDLSFTSTSSLLQWKYYHYLICLLWISTSVPGSEVLTSFLFVGKFHLGSPFFFFFLPPAFLNYNWQINCKVLKAYNVTTWYSYTPGKNSPSVNFLAQGSWKPGKCC